MDNQPVTISELTISLLLDEDGERVEVSETDGLEPTSAFRALVMLRMAEMCYLEGAEDG